MERKSVAISFAVSYIILQCVIAYHVGASNLGPQDTFVMVWGTIMMLMGSLGIALMAAKSNGQVVVGTILAFFGTTFAVGFVPQMAAFLGITAVFLGGYAVYRISR